VEAPKQRLKALQRQIHRELLAPVELNPAVHGFRQGRSILTFAAQHSGMHAVLRMDLEQFFPSISGPRVQALFRTLGYPEPVADLLGGLCTTTTPRSLWAPIPMENSGDRWHLASFYARSHLPQGAPSSPAIANLCAFRLDRRLAGLAEAAGAAYARYADDLAFSGDRQFARGANSFAARVGAIAAEEGFRIQHRKTKLMRASQGQHLVGLTVNQRPNVPRADIDRLRAILTNCVRFGPQSQNREAHREFRRHLEGKVAFVGMVNARRGQQLQRLLEQISWPTDS
jgi:RNA-directed DNA polymerase